MSCADTKKKKYHVTIVTLSLSLSRRSTNHVRIRSVSANNVIRPRTEIRRTLAVAKLRAVMRRDFARNY